MQSWVILEKEVGETPLMAVERWRRENNVSRALPVSYAGRLDPMASGKLLLLLGAECKRQKAYTDLDKEYEVEVLLDMESDTGDALGLVELAANVSEPDVREVRRALWAEVGEHERAYPPFSSKTVAGKPLFLYALEGTLASITIPIHTERVYRATLCSVQRVTAGELQKRVGTFLDLVPRTSEPSKRLGEDFRVDTVHASWEEVFSRVGEREFTILRIRVACGSGSYMRSLAPRLGVALGTSALALSIKRTKIGIYFRLPWGYGFWRSEFE